MKRTAKGFYGLLVICFLSLAIFAGCPGPASDTTASTDTTAPINTTASDFISSGASSTSSTTVTLAISATDSVGVTGYYASETSTAPSAASGWISVTSTTSYSANVSFTLSSGDGTKTVYVWFKDAAGNVSSVASDTITLSTSVSVSAKVPIATTTAYEQAFSAAFDGTNWLVGIGTDQPPAGGGNSADAQFISQSGTTVGPLVQGGGDGGSPIVAYDGSNYLVIGGDCTSNTCTNCCKTMGRLVSPSGTNVGSMFQISSGATERNVDGIAFDGTNYLVIWTDGRKSSSPETTPGGWDVYGQLVSKSGTLVGANFKISGTAGKNGAVAFDGTNYLVTWNEDVYDTDVYGRLISKSGTPASAEFVVNANSYPSDNPLTVAFDGTNYLVVWTDEVSTGEWDVFGQIVTLSGTLSGSMISISTVTGQQFFPQIAFDGTNYLVTWTDMKNDTNKDWICDSSEGTCLDIYGQYISKSGTPVGSEFIINNDSGNQFGGVAGFANGKYLVIVNDGFTNGYSDDVYGVFVTP